VPVEKISMTLNVYTTNGMAIDEIERYWLDLLKLPATGRRATMLDGPRY
jgi:hypothetical protein